jgi:nitrite reductase (NADH) small subunit
MTMWKSVCQLDDILPYSGVATLVGNEQVAIFRINAGDDLYAISNYDPFSQAYVLSRGLVGDRNGRAKVASPIYKQNFDLQSGQCLDDDNVTVTTWDVQVVDGIVQLKIS